MHKNKIVHRDIKMENIVLDDNLNGIQIIDFGMASRISKINNDKG